MLTYNLENRGKKPIYEYIYERIKDDIRHNTIKAGEKLPSKRALADHLGVSILTIASSYQMLIDEGYIYSRQRSGYFVCALEEMSPAPEVFLSTNFHLKSDFSTRNTSNKNTMQESKSDGKSHTGNLHSNITFNFSDYSKVMRKVILKYEREILTKSPPFGCEILRIAISNYLLRYRGMKVPYSRIIIGSGSEYFYGMIVLLLGRDKIYGVENPSYEKISAVYKANGARCDMLNMDLNGILTSELMRTKANVLHVTPFNSYPTGATASASKRYEYIMWAKKTGSIIVEDDIDSEFAVGIKPVETIYSMDKDGIVIYLNTFSKSIAPSMRMGYMILPENLEELYKEKLGFYSCTVPVYDQYVLAEFISCGYFERHLNRTRRVLRQRMKKENID